MSSSSSSDTAASGANTALRPVAATERVFATHDHAALWFSLGVGLLVMQVGAYLVPALGLREALWTIVLGSLVGAGLLGWVAKIGCDSGLGSAALMHHVYGSHFAKLPIALNLIQLMGWGTFELVVMRDATLAISGQSGQGWTLGATVLWGLVVGLMISGSMVKLVRQLIARIALPLVVLSLLWLSWHFVDRAGTIGWDSLWQRRGDGSMSWLSAMDLVIAMPISWLPLVADYARHGKSGGGALRGTWLGFAVANCWCYGLGVLVALTLPAQDLLTALLLAQGGLIALTLILLDEVDNAYGDTYSGSLSLHSLLPMWSVRRWGLVLTALCTALALVLPMHSIEPFLLTLSSVFVPMFGVILGRLAFLPAALRADSAATWMQQARPWHGSAVALWLAGIALYHAIAHWQPQLGAALPTLIVCFALSWLRRPAAARG
ncbi:MAG: cytosine permease [Acidovorax sp.]|jgi:putative hydroxymethylpyrimidine transporter CytX|nr:cytosine permease [Acidovorax sp.]